MNTHDYYSTTLMPIITVPYPAIDVSVQVMALREHPTMDDTVQIPAIIIPTHKDTRKKAPKKVAQKAKVKRGQAMILLFILIVWIALTIGLSIFLLNKPTTSTNVNHYTVGAEYDSGIIPDDREEVI
jgi:hypothetical protein